MKLVIGFITYGENTAKYLPYFLPSLSKQTFTDYKIVAADNSHQSENKNSLYISQNYKDAEIIWSQGNIGFSKANNNIIQRARELGAKYVLLLNPDMLLEPAAVEEMAKALDNDDKLGSVCPRIYKWNFENNIKTNIIDTFGIKEISALRFKDIGQGEKDTGQYDKKEIIGPSGAAAMYRISALEDVKIVPPPLEGGGQGAVEYFDELMFMYEEDCDLAYRLKLAGYTSKCVSKAIIYHDRSASAKGMGNLQVAFNRKNKARWIKEQGFKNKHIIFIKYWQTLSLLEKFSVLWFAFRMFVFTLLFEQYLLKQYARLFKIRKKI
ncbi:glycosyltransferase family 2 protein [Candidatus Parcubacteria bacterium]|nr:glycosyltransferase family 2 protein [Candidatus Parcubacteria bacterium]